MRLLFSIAVVAIVSAIVSASTQLTGVSIQFVSSQLYPNGWDRRALRCIDGSGLNPATGYHTTAPDGYMWLSAGINNLWGGTWFLGGPQSDPNPWIIFQLNALSTVDKIRIWNYNEGGSFTHRGIKNFDLSVSTDNVHWTVIGSSLTLNQAPGSASVDFHQDFSLGNAVAQYVKIQSTSDYGADNGARGLSEVQFYGGAAYCCTAVTDQCNSIHGICSTLGPSVTAMQAACSADPSLCSIYTGGSSLLSICNTLAASCDALISAC